MLLQKNTKILDTNMILRFPLRDNIEMADKSLEIIKNNKVFVTSEVIAEVVFVMQKVYKATREDIYDMMISFINISTVDVQEYSVLCKGLKLFKDNNLDFVDCILCAYNVCYGYEVCTFDVKLKKLIDRLKS